MVISFVLIYSKDERAVSPVEKNCYFDFDSGKKCEFLIEWGWVFHDVNLKNNGAIAIPLLSTICGWVRNSFDDISETFTDGQAFKIAQARKSAREFSHDLDR